MQALGFPESPYSQPSTNMFKATHKRRATTLSKTLLTAGLLGGAALSTLGAGSAQAAWIGNPGNPGPNYSCVFGGIVPCMPNVPTPIVEDKILTILNTTSIANGSNLVFEYQLPDNHPFHVDLDLAPNDTDGGTLGYTLQVSGSSDTIISAFLGAIAPAGIVTKDIYSSAALYNNGTGGAGDLCQLTTLGTQCDFSGVSQVWVRDTWAPTGAGVDSISNDFAQVPAPLPLLGAGAVFGSIRKLRKFSSQLKTFSMG
jgi:hypothetical protein